jgi:hypothetical protein
MSRRTVKVQYVAGVAAIAALALGAQSAGATAAHQAVTRAPSAGAAATRYQSVNVMTYNILELSNQGKHEGDGVVAPWSQRRPKEVTLIHQGHPDVIAIEEGAPLVGHTRQRQVDSLRKALGSPYKLARTEIPPTEPHYFRTGVYIIYNNSTEKLVGQGGHYPLGGNHFAAYQEFSNRTTHAKFLFIAIHLLVGQSTANDGLREQETLAAIKTAEAIAHRRKIPVIYAGDFNSANPKDKKFTFNGAGRAMATIHAKDALVVAPKKTNAQYNSANDLLRTAPKSGDSIDHIYAPPGVKVTSAGLILDLRHGKFVGVIPSDHNPLVAQLRYPY